MAQYGDALRQQSMGAHLRRSYEREQSRGRALRRDLRKGIGPLAPRSTSPGGMAHPPGKVRLGTEPEQGGRVFDLDINELRQHVFIPGASGSGKTTTVARLADGVLNAGWSVVIVDCKGTGLVSTARELSARYGVPLHIVDPGDADSSGYNPCTGDGPDIANKLVGAYSFGPNAEIFENISSNVLSVTVDAMRAAGRPVTVDDLIDTIGTPGGLADLADADGLGSRARSELRRLDAMRPGSLSRDGMDGMVERLRALASGRFGGVLRKQPAVDLRAATRQPSVVLFALSATGADRDVNLMGRVIAQDVKQLCDARLRAGADLTPMMLVFDEFHKLSDAGQIVDLLLQARQAQISVVLATQVLPQDEVIRKPALQSGVLIVHRLETEDAQVLGAQLGTRPALGFTVAPAQSDEETTRVSLRPVDEFIVHPNTIRRLHRPGLVALRSVTTDRDALLEICRPTEVTQ
jgi:hypothetical protein